MSTTKEKLMAMLEEHDEATLQVLHLVAIEVARAERKHPTWPTDIIHAAAIVAEEAGETVQAALQHNYEQGERSDIGTEAVHAAATAVRPIKNLS